MDLEEITIDGSHLSASDAFPTTSYPTTSREVDNAQRSSTKIRAKRPRIIASGTDAYGTVNAPKRIKRPDDYLSLIAPDTPKNARHCIFCLLPGDLPECEGRLLGPFRNTLPNGKPAPNPTFYAHRNCSLWAPEVYLNPSGKLQDVHIAYQRAKRKKCCLCGGFGASLACMFKKSACCRPMHFRCALRGGASLRNGFVVLCPNHAMLNRSGKGPPPPMDLYVDKTPVPDHLLLPGKGCDMCSGDVYDTDNGAILTCSICYSRQHSRCIYPSLERDGPFSAYSWSGKYLCKACMRCFECDKAIDRDVFSSSDNAYQSFSDGEGQESDSDTVKCVGCKHFAIHVRCLPKGTNKQHWRCDLCRICRHCNVANVSRAQWNERYEACPECTKEIRNGGVVCPVCVKVYREGENLMMIQCDYCDKWIHATQCGGLTPERFKHIGASDTKYRCPVCTEAKKKRDLDKRRGRNSTSRDHVGSFGRFTRLTKNDLEAILRQMTLSEDGISFHSIRKASKQRNSLVTVFRNLAIGTDICRHCCSGGSEEELLFCTDCGECYHEFCNQARSDSLFPGKRKRITCKREVNISPESRLGGLGLDAIPWRCAQCESFTNLIAENAPEKNPNCGESSDEPQIMMRDEPFEILANGHAKGSIEHVIPNGEVATVRDTVFEVESEISEPQYEPIHWTDERACELCSKKENHSSPEGRLIPWASNTIADTSHSWVHVGCAIWSSGVSLHGTSGHSDILLGPRKYILSSARRTTCMCCSKTGATLVCSIHGCENAYHFDCAREVAVACVVKFSNALLHKAMRDTGTEADATIDLSHIESLRILCPSHRILEHTSTEGGPCITDTQRLINTRRHLKIVDIQGYAPDAEPPRKKSLSSDRLLSMRIGSLTVLKFGQLVPEVDSFIVKGCLVPLGYSAARRFWSLVNPGQRCIYFFEVCGHAQSGPLFVIRCMDSPNLKMESNDPDQAWSQVVKMVKHAREVAEMSDPSFQSIKISGLEAFGLLNCIPVVTHIESLPMASMFHGRYAHKRVVTHRNDEIIFYNSLSKKYAPPDVKENVSGSARSEGYLPKSWVRKRHPNLENSIPQYENARTGAAFQLQVVREILSQHEETVTEKKKASKGTIMISSGTRNARTKSNSTLPLTTEHQGIAASSKRRSVILRSDINGWGVFATQDIPAGQMIIEYVGELIRPAISDLREVRYCEKGLGCYMFEIVPGTIVDATMCGNAARYINHGCAPNCYSKTIALKNNRYVVVIFSKRRIQRGEELSYDYQFPFDDSDRVKCGCGTPQCKGFMN